MNIKQRLLTSAVALVTIINASGCNLENKQKNNLDSSYTNSLLEENELEIILKENLYDESIDYNLILNKYLNGDRETLKNDYLKAMYMFLLNTNISMDIYIKELEDMLIVHQVPTCVPDDIQNDLFSNLKNACQNYDSLFDLYLDFAIYVHELICLEEHTFSEYFTYTCPNIPDDIKLERIKK